MKLEKSRIFTTCESLEDLYEYFELHNNEEKRLLMLGAGLLWNTLAHLQEQEK